MSSISWKMRLVLALILSFPLVMPREKSYITPNAKLLFSPDVSNPKVSFSDGSSERVDVWILIDLD